MLRTLLLLARPIIPDSVPVALTVSPPSPLFNLTAPEKKAGDLLCGWPQQLHDWPLHGMMLRLRGVHSDLAISAWWCRAVLTAFLLFPASKSEQGTTGSLATATR